MKNVLLFMALAMLSLPVVSQPGPGDRPGGRPPGEPAQMLDRLEADLETVLGFNEAKRKIVLDSYVTFFDEMKALHDKAREEETRPDREAVKALAEARTKRIQGKLSEVDFAAFSTYEKMQRRGEHDRPDHPGHGHGHGR